MLVWGDSAEVIAGTSADVLVFDPPWDMPDISDLGISANHRLVVETSETVEGYLARSTPAARTLKEPGPEPSPVVLAEELPLFRLGCE